MKIFITGVNGFIGQHVAYELSKKKHDIISIGTTPNFEFKDITHKIADFINSVPEKITFSEDDVIIHLACLDLKNSQASPKRSRSINYRSTVELANICAISGARFINLSSSEVYGHVETGAATELREKIPTSYYGHHKLFAEQEIEYIHKKTGLSFVNLRPSNIFGRRRDGLARGTVDGNFIRNCLQGKKMNIFGNIDNSRDFVDIHDVTSSIVKFATFSQSEFKYVGNQAYNLATGTDTRIIDLARFVCSNLGVAENLAISIINRENKLSRFAADISLAKKNFNFSPEKCIFDHIRNFCDNLK